MPKVKILWFVESTTERTEREIEHYLSEGWRIVAAGGGGDAPETVEGRQMMYRPFGMGFIVLQRDDPPPRHEGQEAQKRATQPLEAAKPAEAGVGARRSTGILRRPPNEDETQVG
jgi:hypothetical protein